MWAPKPLILCVSLGLGLLVCLLATRAAVAHPELHDRIEVRPTSGAVDVIVLTSLETVMASLGRGPRSGSHYEPAEIDAAIAAHTPYLASHLRFEIDGKAVTPSVRSARREPGGPERLHRLVDLERAHARYELSLAVPRASRLRIGHAMLTDAVDESGKQWNLTYVVEAPGKGSPTIHVLRAGETVEVPLGSASSSTFATFARVGIAHALTGLDHLLFLAALALAARTFRALVAVVLVFTASHTITLALATSGTIVVPSAIVEPLVALSIVVAAHLAREPGHPSREAAVAFGFGLVHGLAFGGGLRSALSPADGLAVVMLSFALGLELVQQSFVAAAFVAVRWTRARGGQRWLEGARLLVLVLGLLLLFQTLRAATFVSQ